MASSILSFSHLSSLQLASHNRIHFPPRQIPLSIMTKKNIGNSNSLSSSNSNSGSSILFPKSLSPQIKPSIFTVFAAKGYKIKTHKASAKRFRVTGKGKIVRRRAGKQHLLGKKNTKRKLRLSKMHAVDRSDYDNVIRALPHLKVNRKAT